MKSKEELAGLKKEYDELCGTLRELTEEELSFVCGGVDIGNGVIMVLSTPGGKEYDEQILNTN